MSKRQDGCTEVSWNFFNLITPIITFTVALCAMDENVLRDAVLVRLENIRFEAYVHINALMWKVAFAELRALTNRKSVQDSGLSMNLMELNELYDYLWNMDVFMQSETGIEIFQPKYRPWPKLHEGNAVSLRFYERLERNKNRDMAHTAKLVKASQDTSDHVTYLTDLVVAMMQTDSKRTFRSEISLSVLGFITT